MENSGCIFNCLPYSSIIDPHNTILRTSLAPYPPLYILSTTSDVKERKKINMIPFNTISSIRAAMAEECNESSVATSPSIPNWWPADNHLHAGSLGSWSGNTGNVNMWSGGNNSQNPNSNNSRSSGEEDVSMSTSFTNASNHSGLTVESSRRLVESVANNELMGETPSDNPLWNHVFL